MAAQSATCSKWNCSERLLCEMTYHWGEQLWYTPPSNQRSHLVCDMYNKCTEVLLWIQKTTNTVLFHDFILGFCRLHVNVLIIMSGVLWFCCFDFLFLFDSILWCVCAENIYLWGVLFVCSGFFLYVWNGEQDIMFRYLRSRVYYYTVVGDSYYNCRNLHCTNWL